MTLRQYKNPSVIESGMEFHAVDQGGISEEGQPVHVYMLYHGPAATSRCQIEPITIPVRPDSAWNDTRNVYIGEGITLKRDKPLAEHWGYWKCRMVRRWDEA